jgi:HEAT repeat protein
LGEPLVDLFREETNESVKQALLTTLARSTNSLALSLIMNCASNEPSSDLKEIAVRTLCVRNTNFSVTNLAQVLKTSPFNEVRDSALGILCGLRTTESRAALAEFMDKYPSNALALTSSSYDRKLPQIYDLLVRQLSATNLQPVVRESAIRNLGTCGRSNAIPLLLQLITNEPELSARADALEALAQLHAIATVPVLTNLLITSPNSEFRCAVARTLGSMGDKRATPVLLATLNQNNYPALPQAACDALGALGDPSAIPALLKFATKRNPLRTLTVNAIGEIGGPQAVAFLVSELRRMKDSEDSTYLVELLEACQLTPDPSFVPFVIEDLDHIDERVVHAAAKACGRLNATAAIPQLIALTTSGGKNVRAAACRALGELGDSRALPVLVRVLQQDRCEEARVKAAEALALIGNTGPIPDLRIALNDRAEAVRNEVACSLGHLGDEDANTVAAVVALLKQGAPNVKIATCYYLSEIGHEGGANALKEALDDREEGLLLSVACGLAARGLTNGVDILGESLDSESPATRVFAISALGQLKSIEAAQMLRKQEANGNDPLSNLVHAALAGEVGRELVQLMTASDIEVRRAATFQFVYVIDPLAIPALNKACHDRDAAIQDAARWSVRRLLRLTTKQKHEGAG